MNCCLYDVVLRVSIKSLYSRNLINTERYYKEWDDGPLSERRGCLRRGVVAGLSS